MSALDWVGLWAAIQVIGIVIGAFLFVAFVAAILFLLWLDRR